MLVTVATLGGLSSISVASRPKKGVIGCKASTFRDVLSAFEGHPQEKVDFVGGRWKDEVPEQFHHLLDSLEWKPHAGTDTYTASSSEWDAAIEKARGLGASNEDLRSTITFLASITPKP